MILERRSAWARFRASRAALFGLGVVGALIAFSLLGPAVIPSDPNTSHFSLPRSAVGGPPGPSLEHPLGADALFRDVLARLAAGGRLSLGIALIATMVSMAVGLGVGLVAGWFEGSRWRAVDTLLMRVVDVALAFPYLLLVTAIGVALDEAGPATIALVLGLTGWIGIARLVRARTMELKARDHVLAARALGVRTSAVVFRHVLPGLRGALLVLASQAVGQFVLAEAVLGYLTVGVGPPQASWGRMLQEAEHFLGAQSLLVGAPAFAIVLTVLGFTRVADGIAEATDSRAVRPAARFPADAIVLVGVVAVLVGFSGTEPLPAPVRAPSLPSGVLRLGSSLRVGTLDPALVVDEPTARIGELVHARLLTHDAAGRLVGDLAESFAVEDDGRRVRLRLREGLTFHDGSRLVAADVKRSFERAFHPDTPSRGTSAFAALAGIDAFRRREANGIAGLEVASELEVVMHLDTPDAAFPSLLGLGLVAPVCASGGTHADPSQPTPCGAGPFRLLVQHEDAIELGRFAGYHRRGLPRVEGIAWSLGLPVRAQLFRFLRGEQDLLSEVTSIDAQRFGADPRWDGLRAWSTTPIVEGVFLNVARPPFDNRHLRRAVAFALDPSVLPVLRPSLAAIDRVLPDGIPRPAEAPHRTHDLHAALEEMRLAGHPYDPESGRGGYPGIIDYITVPASLDQGVAEVYQQQLARIGIRLRIRLLSFPSYLATVGTRDACAMGWRAWVPDFPDPAGVIDPTLTGAAISDRGSQNVSFFGSHELDRLASAARHEPNVDERMKLYEAVERIVRDEAPWIPTYANRLLWVWHPYVRPSSPGATGRFDLAELSLGESEAQEP